MNAPGRFRSPRSGLFLSVVTGVNFAQAGPAKEYQPEVGPQGKDGIWVPTAQYHCGKHRI